MWDVFAVLLHKHVGDIDSVRIVILSKLQTGSSCQPRDELIPLAHLNFISPGYKLRCSDSHNDFHFKRIIYVLQLNQLISQDGAAGGDTSE